MEELSTYQETLYKDMYYKELEYKDKINSEISLIATIIILLAGVLISFLPKTLKNLNFHYLSAAYYIFYVISSYFIINAIWKLKNVFYDNKYSYLIDPLTIRRNLVRRKNYYKAIQAKKIENKLIFDLKDDLIRELSQCTFRNMRSNFYRRNNLFHSKKSIAISIIFIFITSLLFYIERINDNEITKVEIININGETKMSTTTNQTKQPTTSQTTIKSTPPKIIKKPIVTKQTYTEGEEK